MMTCRELAELLIDFVSGELAPEHQERVEQHLGLYVQDHDPLDEAAAARAAAAGAGTAPARGARRDEAREPRT